MIKPDAYNCCGCGVCAEACGHSAIEMKKDELGFKIARVNEDRCIDCSLCDRICPFINNRCDNPNPVAYAARHKNIEEVRRSRSGAIFVALSDYILENNGAIYGAGFGSNFVVTHKRADSGEIRDTFRGSKYAQSDMTGIYSLIKKDLRDGIPVLFSGTPCQVSAVNNYIPDSIKDKLYTIDIICHGVASPRVWKEFIDYIKKKEHIKLITVNFRDKNIFGWSGLHRESFVFSKNKVKTYPFTFYKSFLIRESCSRCPFTSLKRQGDVTLGDFWGWNNTIPDFVNDDLGVSLILSNTAKGTMLLEEVKKDLNLRRIKLTDVLQPNLQYPTSRDPRSDEFKRDYANYGFNYVRKKYWKASFVQRVKTRIKNLLREFK